MTVKTIKGATERKTHLKTANYNCYNLDANAIIPIDCRENCSTQMQG